MTRIWQQAAHAICLLCAMIFFNAGCSSPNAQSSSSFNPETGLHVAGWTDPSMHGQSAKSAADGFFSCEECHGSNYTGGISAVQCSTCHGGSAPHPTSWITGAYTHTNTNTGNASVCAQCHANGTNSPVSPPSPAAPAGTAPGCFNSTLCHAEPACGTCHVIPPNGSASPNIAGSHAPHMSANSSIACSTCHFGAGSGTPLHQNGVVDVILDTAYNAKSGTATFNSGALTCSNIVCHGGSRTQTASQGSANPPQSTPGQTPVWGSGTIDVNSQCTLCHVLGSSAGNPENNSYYSGQHQLHVYEQNRACTVCHDTTKLALVHFTSLTAPISEATASTTINSAINFNGTTCNPSAGGLTGCHSSHTW